MHKYTIRCIDKSGNIVKTTVIDDLGIVAFWKEFRKKASKTNPFDKYIAIVVSYIGEGGNAGYGIATTLSELQNLSTSDDWCTAGGGKYTTIGKNVNNTEVLHLSEQNLIYTLRYLNNKITFQD